MKTLIENAKANQEREKEHRSTILDLLCMKYLSGLLGISDLRKKLQRHLIFEQAHKSNVSVRCNFFLIFLGNLFCKSIL